MVAVLAIVVVTVVVGSIAIAVFLRSYVAKEISTEARLHDPHTHTVAFAIPNGVDPVAFQVGLNRAGFTSAIDRVGNAECLRVECLETERSQVRSLIEAAHTIEYDGSELRLVGHVVFEDEH
jgi:hypothetical protein